MTLKQVLVIQTGLLVGGVIDDVLKNHDGELEVHSISPVKVADLRRAFKQFKPDIIIADDTSPDKVLQAIMLIALRYPDVRVVVICAGSNRVQIYNAEQIEVTHTEDFFAIL
jgi:DNA-binding NarL/FixJ family response regulator